MNTRVASRGKSACSPSKRSHPSTATAYHARTSAPSSPHTPRLLIQPGEAWDARAISHFLYHFSFTSKNGAPGYLDFLSDLLAKNPSAPYLESAVLAAGSANLGNITGLAYLQQTAEKQYGQTLRYISAALKDPSQASSDAVLAAIVVLQIYEVIAGITRVSCDPHQRGLVELSRLRRGSARPRAESENSLLQIIHGRVHVNAIGGLSPSSIDIDYDGETVNVRPHEAELWQLMRRTSQCCVKTQVAVSASRISTLQNEAIKSLDDLLSVYFDLLRWRDTLPSTRAYQSCKTPAPDCTSHSGPIYPEKYHLFKDIQNGAMWISFWCTIVYALQVLVDASSLPYLEQFFAERKYSTQNLRYSLYGAVDDICACVPYMLGDVDWLGLPTIGKDSKALGAFFLLRGLYVASCVKDLRTRQREYMNAMFLRIAYGKGIKLALRPRTRWLAQQ
ncbi:hypothetical protein NPX13_g2913 [Xylaria arbuscula]|uniref:Uncharacterized protein n=1 Tax=Xylaria arbuscula TaxID=114810 RepID=A0A9W8NIA1_9PEZI|nr:hypothetical protein NPX13_g2913 [Xylaria arbuscula]